MSIELKLYRIPANVPFFRDWSFEPTKLLIKLKMGEAAPPPERELTELEGLQLKCNQVKKSFFQVKLEYLLDMCILIILKANLLNWLQLPLR